MAFLVPGYLKHPLNTCLKKVGAFIGWYTVWVRYCCEHAQVSALMSLEHNLWTYAYMRYMAAFILECGDKWLCLPSLVQVAQVSHPVRQAL